MARRRKNGSASNEEEVVYKNKSDMEVLHDWSEVFPYTYNELIEMYKRLGGLSLVRGTISKREV